MALSMGLPSLSKEIQPLAPPTGFVPLSRLKRWMTSPVVIGSLGSGWPGGRIAYSPMSQTRRLQQPDVVYFAGRGQELKLFVEALPKRTCTDLSLNVVTGRATPFERWVAVSERRLRPALGRCWSAAPHEAVNAVPILLDAKVVPGESRCDHRDPMTVQRTDRLKRVGAACP